MNKFMLSFLILISFNSFAVEREIVGCLNPATSTTTFNALFDVTYNRLNSYTIEVEGQLLENELIAEEREVGPFYFKYAENDVNVFGYSVVTTPDLLGNWKVESWTSTTSIDDATAEVGTETVECYKLLKAPSDLKVDAKNIEVKIQ